MLLICDGNQVVGLRMRPPGGAYERVPKTGLAEPVLPHRKHSGHVIDKNAVICAPVNRTNSFYHVEAHKIAIATLHICVAVGIVIGVLVQSEALFRSVHHHLEAQRAGPELWSLLPVFFGLEAAVGAPGV